MASQTNSLVSESNPYDENSLFAQICIAIGIERAKARAALRYSKGLVLRYGGRRFGPAPAQTQAALEAISDGGRLERMQDRLVDATAIDWADLLATA